MLTYIFLLTILAVAVLVFALILQPIDKLIPNDGNTVYARYSTGDANIDNIIMRRERQSWLNNGKLPLPYGLKIHVGENARSSIYVGMISCSLKNR